MQRAETSRGKDEDARRAHGVLVGPREERDANSSIQPSAKQNIYMLVGLRRSLAGVESEIVIQRISAVFEEHMRPFRLIVGDEIYEKLADSDRKAANRTQPTAEG